MYTWYHILRYRTIFDHNELLGCDWTALNSSIDIFPDDTLAITMDGNITMYKNSEIAVIYSISINNEYEQPF